ncbi:MAG: FAD-dependent oxidoreductase [Erysipelotrichia bacterium]|nr:FAD-dependent oxidoreductase [Erysipelotrichia bacterium]
MKLLAPIKVGNLTLKNRVMFPPLTTGYETRDGSIGEQSFHFYKRLAQGGVGYIVLGDVSPVNTASPTPKLYDDKQIPSFKKLADAVHEYDCKIALQLFHPEYDVLSVGKMIMASRMAMSEAQKAKENGDMDKFKAKMEEAKKTSDDAYAKLHHDMQHFVSEATFEQLEMIKMSIAQSARRASEAGIDAIEVHGDRLLGSMCSTVLNHRDDIYGGCFENRIRYALEVVKVIKQAAPNLMIEYKLPIITINKDGSMRGKGGLLADEGIAFAKALASAGVDMIQVAQANHTGNMGDTIPPMASIAYHWLADVAKRVKEVVSIPVASVGRIVTPQVAEALITADKMDIVGLGRSLLCDPDFVKKLEQKKADEIRLCINCNKGCTDNIQNRKFLSCVLNAENGYEYERSITPAMEKKKVVVVGGGPAGLEAARVASSKRHEVVLFEKDTKLGGQLNIASVPPRKYEMLRAIQYLTKQVVASNVDLRLGKMVSAKDIIKENCDALIVAVGASNAYPPIANIDLPHVLDAWKVLANEQLCSGRIVVIGGGLVGSECAELLAQQGNQVTIIEMLDEIAKEESATIKPIMQESFAKYNVVQMCKTKVQSISSTSVECQNEAKESISIPCDYVVLATGAKANSFDVTGLKEQGIEVIFVGDCNEKTADINRAIEEGYLAANQL